MVTRKRLRRILNALAPYASASLLIGYFGINAYNGNRGLKAKEDIERQMVTLNVELDHLKAQQAQWERRIALLRSDDLDPDMLDERARILLDYADPHDLTLMLDRPSVSAAAPKP